MAARGESYGVSPQACPFVALEDDRDARAASPEPRHRCYAEPTPQPRALPHQEAFCLSPTFAGCPIFQDWAARAAARPVSPVAAASAATEQLGVFDAVDAPPPRVTDEDALVDHSPTAAERGAAGVPGGVLVTGSLDAPATSSESDARVESNSGNWSAAAAVPAVPDEPGITVPEDPHQVSVDHEVPSPYARDASTADVPAESEIPPVPPFLAGRSGAESAITGTGAAGAAALPGAPAMPTLSSEVPTAPAADSGHAGRTEPIARQVEIPPPSPRSSAPRGIASERVERGDVVPSWDIDGRFGAQPEPEPSQDRYGGWLTAVAVVVILGLGVAGVIFLPGLLSGPGRTPAPSGTIRPTVVATASAPLATPTDAVPTDSATPDETDPTAAPTVEGTPQLYRIRRGDSLARIARRFDLTVADILAANPDIANPNEIQVGQSIVIPQPLPTAAP